MKKNQFKVFLTAVFLAGIVFSCKDESLQIKTPDTASDIANAKTWYETNIPQVISFKAGNVNPSFINIKPNWDEARVNQNDKYKTVESVISSQGQFSFVTPECTRKFHETNDPNYKQSLTRIVIQTDKITNKKIGFLMTIIPSLKYLEDTKFKPFKNTYLKRDENFGGYIVYHNLNGQFVNGWKYLNGKITHTVKNINGSDQTFNLKSSGTLDCTVYQYTVIFSQCMDWFTVHDNGDVYNGTTCTFYSEQIGLWQECSWLDNNGEDIGTIADPGLYTPTFIHAEHRLQYKSKLPPDSTTNVQIANLCVFKIMEWLSKYYGKFLSYDESLAYYSQLTGLDQLIIKYVLGVSSGNLFGLISHYYNATFLINVNEAIDAGRPLLASLINADGSEHEVWITGYYDAGGFEYFDPQLGIYCSTSSLTAFDQIFEITGTKF